MGYGVTLDELRLYDRTLSADEVARHFSSPGSLVTSEVFVAKVWPRKLRYHPREKVEIEAGIASMAQEPRQVRAKIFLEHDVNDRISLLDSSLEIAPGETKDFAIQWAPEGRGFGFDVVVELTDAAGRLLDRRSETFLVGKNAYQLSQQSGMAFWGWDEDAVRRARDHVIAARRNYLTITEVMGVNPDNFSKCAPDTDKWFAGQGSSQYRNSKAAVDAIADEVEYPKKHGGFLNIGWFPWWLAGEVYGKHLLSITFAARARISGAPGFPLNMPYFRFAARFSKLLYDERVRRAPDWRRRIQVEPSAVWWKNYVYEHDCSNGEQLIVHLVNPPATERVVIDGKQAPEPRKDLLVRLTPPDGRRPAAVYVLSPDLEPYCRKLTCEPQGQELRVRIPELKYWDLLVLVF